MPSRHCWTMPRRVSSTAHGRARGPHQPRGPRSDGRAAAHADRHRQHGRSRRRPTGACLAGERRDRLRRTALPAHSIAE